MAQSTIPSEPVIKTILGLDGAYCTVNGKKLIMPASGFMVKSAPSNLHILTRVEKAYVLRLFLDLSTAGGSFHYCGADSHINHDHEYVTMWNTHRRTHADSMLLLTKVAGDYILQIWNNDLPKDQIPRPQVLTKDDVISILLKFFEKQVYVK